MTGLVAIETMASGADERQSDSYRLAPSATTKKGAQKAE
jgi:hypothetical protein